MIDRPLPDHPALHLRPLHSADSGALARLADDPRISGQLFDTFPHPYTLEDAQRFLDSVAGSVPPWTLAIAERASGSLIGCIGLQAQRDVHAHTAMLGYWLGAPFWGRGIATAAVRAMVPYAFDTLGLERLFAQVFSSNPASRRVLQKAGFADEGCLLGHVRKRGRVLDLWVLGLRRPPPLSGDSP